MRLNPAYLILSVGLFSVVHTMPTKNVASSKSYDSDESDPETSKGNHRPLTPSTPSGPLPPLRVEYRQPDDKHPVLEGVEGPKQPDEVVKSLVGRRYGQRDIVFDEKHAFHVLDNTFLWFRLYDDVEKDKRGEYTPCYPHAYFTVDWRRVEENKVPASQLWVEPSTDPDKTSESWKKGDYPWPRFTLD
ncbi:hypothetical protein FB446DRAFT_711395 [Lentinula raphanica]|nr:hypothetical protein FB446DRAFT_711395 [Lentinula raphanica]